MEKLFHRGKWLRSKLVNLNEVVQVQMMLNDQEGQKTLLHCALRKNPGHSDVIYVVENVLN